MVQGTLNHSSPRQPPGADSTFLPSCFCIDPKPIDQLDNELSTSGPATKVTSERELRERQKKENETIEPEKLEVRCGFYPFRRDVILTPLQRETKRNELEREKQEEAKERKEVFEVCGDPHFFRQSTFLTTS